MMKLSICIPQYNGIKFLLDSLRQIEMQTYPNLEVVISDDCSSDTTQSDIAKLSSTYKYPIIYHRHSQNLGYDRNLRSSIELASGDYVILIGNDDTINPDYDLGELVNFLYQNNYPDVGYSSYLDAATNKIDKRATLTAILGKGTRTAALHYSRFSFVGGVIYKRSSFLKHNTAHYDGSVYTQIYHSSTITASGGVLFSIAEPVVIKDILPAEKRRASYTDVIARNWKQYRKDDGGLISVIHVLLGAFKDAGVLNEQLAYKLIRKIYITTLPYWMMEYRKHGAFPEAVGIMAGMKPSGIREIKNLKFNNRIKILLIYYMFSSAALIMPVKLFEYVKSSLWQRVNKQ